MARSEIQTERMINYFIDATAKLIKEEGIKNISIRKIAKEAGYTSSTIYNYFSEVSHLIFFAGMRFVESYIEDLPKYSARAKDPLEKYLSGWECFCDHSFKEPELYHAIFIADLGEHPEELLKYYSSMYKFDTIQLDEELEIIFTEQNLSKRSKEVLEKYAEKGVFKKEDIEKLNEITILIWQGMIISLLNNRVNYTPEEASRKTMEYIRDITFNAANIDPIIKD
ncbi:TetR/AcrR family transcriptional regulator [Bacillus taeanensis]|uniref:TetR/AcrR family transcriptional regulator n=1 Tax=Bacillus taeanensis TaxID=273032 RepID=A0A366Y3I3_9BACI|nr:TetR/AcrR family transcriptional regulator [Bacillus taeanensis]RBW70751.1 TetR/AcrR family transcriptional regulator [Bacillus taeanensis]